MGDEKLVKDGNTQSLDIDKRQNVRKINDSRPQLFEKGISYLSFIKSETSGIPSRDKVGEVKR